MLDAITHHFNALQEIYNMLLLNPGVQPSVPLFVPPENLLLAVPNEPIGVTNSHGSAHANPPSRASIIEVGDDEGSHDPNTSSAPAHELQDSKARQEGESKVDEMTPQQPRPEQGPRDSMVIGELFETHLEEESSASVQPRASETVNQSVEEKPISSNLPSNNLRKSILCFGEHLIQPSHRG